MKLNPLAVALFTLAFGSPLVTSTDAHADQLPRPWIVWQKVSTCAENRMDWMTVAQEDPTMYGLNHYQVAFGYQQTFDFSAAMAQMATLRQGAQYSNSCCQTWSVWKQSGTNELGVVHGYASVSPGWMLEAGDMCCESAMDRAGIAGGCGTGLPLTRTAQRRPTPPPPTGGNGGNGGGNRICDSHGGMCVNLGGGGGLQAVSFNGTWQTSWGNIYLTQSGNNVSGTYDHDGGRIAGTLSGNTLTYRWAQASGRQGTGTFTLSPDGRTFSGPWNYTNADGSVGSGGSWGGTKL